MSARFLFPCPNCEQSIELQTVQAGQQITCPECSHTTNAPKLGDLKKLPLAGGTPIAKSTSPSALKRILIGSGLTLTLLMSVLGTALYWYAGRLIVDVDWEEELTHWENHIDELPAAEVYGLWNSIDVETGLGAWQEQALARYRTQGLILQKIAYGLWFLAIVGVVLIASSFFVRGP